MSKNLKQLKEEREEIALELALWDAMKPFLPMNPLRLIYVLSKMVLSISAKKYD